MLALDGQASGATPAYGDLLELGWAVCSAQGLEGAVQSRWLLPRTERPIGRAVRELTGWNEACLADAVEERVAWKLLRDELTGRFVTDAAAPIPTVIHFARFEQPFLRDLHARLSPELDFPFDAVCLHAIAARLFPELPRRNLRALAGYLGHSPELIRRASGHVEATAFIWRELIPLLEAEQVATWPALKTWLAERKTAPRPERRSFPLPPERRRALPDGAGVYRFVRRNGDVIYVGKAVSLKKRVASHFKSRGPVTERGLELLTQVHDIRHTETPTLLEAALLETDEIKRLDPPYNVQLRAGERCAWFVTRDFRDARTSPDGEHPLGPLPSRGALVGLAELIALVENAPPSDALRASALAVSRWELPDEALFAEGLRIFVEEHLRRSEPSAARRVLAASRALWLARGRAELESAPADAAAPAWDLNRVRRRLERTLVQTGLLLRRASLLALLSDADVAFRERASARSRVLVIAATEIRDRYEVSAFSEARELPKRRPRSRWTRQSSFDAVSYDRMRVLVTELRRVFDEGGDVAFRIGSHHFGGARAASILRSV